MSGAYRNIQAQKLTGAHAAYLVGALGVWAKNEDGFFGGGEGTDLARRVLDGLIATSPEIVEEEKEAVSS